MQVTYGSKKEEIVNSGSVIDPKMLRRRDFEGGSPFGAVVCSDEAQILSIPFAAIDEALNKALKNQLRSFVTTVRILLTQTSINYLHETPGSRVLNITTNAQI